MIASKITILTAVAALSEQALGFNSHRHLHHQAEKRALETEWVTDWVTVYVTAGAEAEVATSSSSSPVPVPTTTTTTTSSPPPPPATTSSEVEEVEAAAAAPAPQTTLTTAAKPADEGLINAGLSIGISIGPDPTTQAAPPATTSADSGSGSGSSVGFSSKRGLAYNDASLANFFASQCPGCSWAWNWGSSTSNLDSNLDYIPMLWSPAPVHSNHWQSDAEAAIAKNTKALFSFNECDNAGQCNMSPSAAAAAHNQYMNQFAGKTLIGAPSITNSESANKGLDWLQQFFDACDQIDGGCHVDFINLHWYAPASSEDYLFSHLEKANKVANGKPLWLTEFAPSGSDDEVKSFLESALPKLDSLDYLDAYSYFMVATGNLMSTISSLSSFGLAYAS